MSTRKKSIVLVLCGFISSSLAFSLDTIWNNPDFSTPANVSALVFNFFHHSSGANILNDGMYTGMSNLGYRMHSRIRYQYTNENNYTDYRHWYKRFQRELGIRSNDGTYYRYEGPDASGNPILGAQISRPNGFMLDWYEFNAPEGMDIIMFKPCYPGSKMSSTNTVFDNGTSNNGYGNVTGGTPYSDNGIGNYLYLNSGASVDSGYTTNFWKRGLWTTSGSSLAQLKVAYRGMLNIFVRHPEKLFIVMQGPPQKTNITATEAGNCRELARWFREDFLHQYDPTGTDRFEDYPLKNVAPFDLENAMAITGNDAALDNEYLWFPVGGYPDNTFDSNPWSIAGRAVGAAQGSGSNNHPNAWLNKRVSAIFCGGTDTLSSNQMVIDGGVGYPNRTYYPWIHAMVNRWQKTQTPDTTAPIVSAPASMTTNAAFTAILGVNENYGYWRTNAAQTFMQFTTAGTSLLIDRTTTMWFYGRDSAGNNSTTNTATYTFNTTSTNVSLAGNWRFDEGGGTVALDSTSLNNGTISGAVYAAGRKNSGLLFDGIDDKVDFSTHLGITGALTVCAWVKPYLPPAGLGRMIAATYSYTTNTNLLRGWYLGNDFGSDNLIKFSLYGGGPRASISLSNFFTAYSNSWVHVAGVLKPGEYIRLYTNGVLAVNKNTTFSQIVYNDAVKLRIGGRADNAYQARWSGMIDETAIYNGALSQEQIAAMITTVNPPVVTVGPSSITTNQPFSAVCSVDKNYGYFSTNRSTFMQFTTAGTNLSIDRTTTLWFYGCDSAGNNSTTNMVTYTFNATSMHVYEDAENGTTNNWLVYDNTPAGAGIGNVFDADRGSRVIQFSGTGRDNGYRHYRNGVSNWNDTVRKVAQWSMKFSAPYDIYFLISTGNGSKYIYYRALPTNYRGAATNAQGVTNYVSYGLGTDSTNGTWQAFTRNLEADLHDILPNETLLAVNSFLIRGSGYIDDIALMESMPVGMAVRAAGGAETLVMFDAGRDNEHIAAGEDRKFAGEVRKSERATLRDAVAVGSPSRGNEITFANLMPGTTMKIFTVTGIIVADAAPLNGGKAVWNLMSKDGKRVAPGVYLATFRAGTEQKTIKIMVVR